VREPILIEAPLNGTHPMKLSDVRELLHVTQTRTDGTLLRACPLHPTMTLAIIIRRDGSLKVECPAGCREAILAAALQMETEALLAIRVTRAAVRTPISIDTPSAIAAARDPDGRLLPIAEIMTRQRQAAQDEIWEALKAVEDDKINEMTAEQHLHELTRVDDHVPAVVVEGEKTKAQIKEEEKARTRTIYQVRVERNNPELPLFIQRVAKLDRLERPGYLFLANERKLFPGFELKNLKAWLDKVENPPASATAEPAPVNAAELAALREQAAEILDANDPLLWVQAELRRIEYGGDLKPPTLVYLGCTTRLLPKRVEALPCHTQLNGPPGTGKSFILKKVRTLLPENAYVTYDAGSQRVLIYDPASYKHKVIFFAEADSLPGVAKGEEDNPAASLLRSLLQDGEAHYKLPVKDKETGQWTIQEITKDGPTVLITTTVNRVKGEQLDSRLFAIDVPDDPAQQRAALQAHANAELRGPTVEPLSAYVAMQEYFQALAPLDVVVPYVRALDVLLGRSRVDARLLRDAARLLSLIKAIAILRSAHRDRDDQGRIVATLDDYQTMADLIADVYENTTGVSAKVRELVAALPEHGVVSETQLARGLGISRQAVSKRLRTALKNEWIVNSEERRRYPARLRRGDPLPHECGLPSVEQIERWVPRTPVSR